MSGPGAVTRRSCSRKSMSTTLTAMVMKRNCCCSAHCCLAEATAAPVTLTLGRNPFHQCHHRIFGQRRRLLILGWTFSATRCQTRGCHRRTPPREAPDLRRIGLRVVEAVGRQGGWREKLTREEARFSAGSSRNRQRNSAQEEAQEKSTA
jgi:hypothetical protein